MESQSTPPIVSEASPISPDAVPVLSDVKNPVDVDFKKLTVKYKHFPYFCEACEKDCKYLPLIECDNCKAVVCSDACLKKLRVDGIHKAKCKRAYTDEEAKKFFNGRTKFIDFCGEELLPFPLVSGHVPRFAVKASELDTSRYQLNIDPSDLSKDLYLVRLHDIKRYTEQLTAAQWDESGKMLKASHEERNKFVSIDVKSKTKLPDPSSTK